jgi:hypothetical protein
MQISDVEAGPHDADDRPPHTADFDDLPERVRVRAKRRPPQLVREDDDIGTIRTGLHRLEPPAEFGARAERLQQTVTDAHEGDAAGPIGRGEIDLCRGERANRRKRLARSWSSKNSGGDTQN